SETPQKVADEKEQLKAAIAKLARPDRETIRLVWDTVFWRRAVYFLTVTLTFVLVAYPWLGGLLTKAAHLALRSIPAIGIDLDTNWHAWLDRLNDGSRGPVTNLVDAISGFIPGYLELWIKALERHPIEFASIAIGIMICMAASSVLQARIHD